MPKVTRVTPLHMGHTHITFEDGSMKVITRGQDVPKVGEMYPKPAIAASPARRIRAIK